MSDGVRDHAVGGVSVRAEGTDEDGKNKVGRAQGKKHVGTLGEVMVVWRAVEAEKT